MPHPRSTLRRLPERALYDRKSVYSVIDAAPICHVGFVDGGQPFVIPTIHARMADRLVLHGSSASRLMKHAAAGHPLCITVTILEGLVLARSLFHSSMNYRSAVIFGTGVPIDEPDEKLAALRAISDHLQAGRWEDARQPTSKEMKATGVVSVAIDEATVKTRSGPPGDDAADYALPIWAGVIPLRQVRDAPVPDPGRHRDEPIPNYLSI